MTLRMLTNRSYSGQQVLFHEDIYGAIAGLIAALGGAKVVGSRLMPDLSVDTAHKRLLEAINPDRPQNLTLTQFTTLLKWGREAGYHGAMEYLAEGAGYTKPQARTPEEERADLQRQYVESVRLLEQIAKKLQK